MPTLYTSMDETPMFCFQCQEAAKGTGCTIKGVCGKTHDVANLQDLLLYSLKGIAWLAEHSASPLPQPLEKEVALFITDALFTTITNANFDRDFFFHHIRLALALRSRIEETYSSLTQPNGTLPHAATWNAQTDEELEQIAMTVGVRRTSNEDIRSLRELIMYGLKGMAAYTYHAEHLHYSSTEVDRFMRRALAATLDDTLGVADLLALAMEAGKYGVDAMAMLDQANTSTYGHPEITKVNIGVGIRLSYLILGI